MSPTALIAITPWTPVGTTALTVVREGSRKETKTGNICLYRLSKGAALEKEVAKLKGKGDKDHRRKRV